MMHLISILESSTLLLLLILSVWSFSVVINRYRVFKHVFIAADYEQAQAWVHAHPKTTPLQKGALATQLMEVISKNASQDPMSIEAATKSFLQLQKLKLEKGLTVLATLGSNAPFIGLFGTVLGIIRAFSILSSESMGSGAVMPLIGKALLATATGIFVAIPAVVAFNYFSSRLRSEMVKLDALKNLYLSKVTQ